MNKFSFNLALSILFLLIVMHQSATPSAYGEGTTDVNFSKSGIGNMQTAPPIAPGTITVQGANLNSNNNYSPLLNYLINNFIQQGYVVPSTETPTKTTSVLSTSQPNSIQKSASIFNILQTPEPTDEIMPDVPANTLYDGESLLPSAESYSVTVCLPYDDLFVAGCKDKNTPLQASKKLAAMIINNNIKKGGGIRPFKVIIPSSMPSASQYQLLSKIETEAIDILESISLKDDKHRKNKSIVSDLANQARLEAEIGTNWSHSIINDRSIHEFNIN